MSNRFKATRELAEDEAGKTDDEEKYLLQLREMGFDKKQIRAAAEKLEIKINRQTMEILTDYLLSNSQTDCSTSGSRHHHRPVQIICPDPDNQTSYQINKEEITRIFGHPDVTNTAVSIYSVAGAFRKGKSFILNLFLRYLWADEQNKGETWLQSKEDELKKGFGWRGGQESHTQGIWIWDEPFFKETPNGRVAIFLMDTQGSFDPKSSMADCAVIFALSTLISSVQIYNVSQQVQEDSLQHLQLFTDYGKVAQSQQKNLQEKPFQKLMFLVRDWQDPDYSYDLEGGRNYLDTVFQIQPKHKDLSSVRQHIFQSFEEVSCCLMPHPGKIVAVRGAKQENNLKLKDVDTEFLDTTDILVHKLFSSQNLVRRRINGKIVMGKDLINYLFAYFEVFKSGKLPKVSTIMEATAKANILIIVKECNDSYRAGMNQACKTYLCEEDLKKVHMQIKKKVLDSFDKQPKFGDKKFVTDYLKYLKDGLEHDFNVIYKPSNIVKLERIKFRFRECVDGAKKMYRSWLNEASSEPYIKEHLLAGVYQKCRNNVLDSYKKETSQLPRDIGKEYLGDLIIWMEEEFQLYKNLNKRNQEELCRKLEEMSFRALATYEKQMNMNCRNVHWSGCEFDQAHKSAETKSVNQFDETNFGNNTDERSNERKLLFERIENERQKYFESNEQKKELKQSKIKNALNEAKDCYMTSMQAATSGNYLTEDLLAKTHEESLTRAMKMIQNETTQIPRDAIKQYCEELQNFTKREFTNIQSDNESKKNAMVDEQKKKIHKIVKEFQKMMDAKAKEYLDEEKLKRLYTEEESKTKREFANADNNLPTKKFDSLKQQLEKDLKAYYVKLCERNRDLKIKMELKADMMLNESKTVYSETMKQICEEGYVAPETIEEAHRESKEKAEKRMNPAEKNMVPFADSCKTQLDEFICQEFVKFKQRNERNKEIAKNLLKGRKHAALNQYMQQIDNKTESYTDELEKLHEDEKSKTLDNFGKGDTKPVDEYMRLRTELINDIDKHYQVACRRNETHKKRLKDEAEMVLQCAKQEYCQHMHEECDGKTLTDSRLDEIHLKYRESAINKLEKFRNSCPSMTDDFKIRCKNEINNCFESFKKQNDENWKMLVIGVGTGAGGAVGAAGGAWAGAVVGAAVGGPIGAGVGAVVGAIGGAAGGGVLGNFITKKFVQ